MVSYHCYYTPINANKFLLQTAINQKINAGYKISSLKSSTPSCISSQPRKRNWQHQKDEAHAVPLIAGIHRPAKRAIIDLVEKKVNMEVTAVMDQTLTRRTMLLSQTTTMPMMRMITMRRM